MDTQALEQLYLEHKQGLFSVAVNITRRADLAEDAIHTAFARICNRMDDLDGDLTAYVYTAVRNAAIDIHRMKKHALPIEESIYVPNREMQDRPDQIIEGNEHQTILQELVDDLSEDQREIIIMKHYTGLTFRQIAQALEQPLATVASRYRRTLDKLKSKLMTKT